MSANAESSKTLAAIGALLLFLSFIPVVGIIGIILILIGMKGLSEYYKDDGIYQHALKGVLFGIIGIVAVTVLSISGFIGGLFSIFTLGVAGAIGGVLIIIAAVLIAFVFYLLMAMNFRRAFDVLADRSGEHLFRSSGTILFIGAVLTIILVGLILVWIAWLILAIAFFSMRLTPAQPMQQPYSYTAPPPPQPQTIQATRYCPNCGAPVGPYAIFCSNCGGQLQPTA